MHERQTETQHGHASTCTCSRGSYVQKCQQPIRSRDIVRSCEVSVRKCGDRAETQEKEPSFHIRPCCRVLCQRHRILVLLAASGEVSSTVSKIFPTGLDNIQQCLDSMALTQYVVFPYLRISKVVTHFDRRKSSIATPTSSTLDRDIVGGCVVSRPTAVAVLMAEPPSWRWSRTKS